MFFDDFVNFFIKICDWLMEIDEKPSKNDLIIATDLIIFHDYVIAIISMFFILFIFYYFSTFFYDFPST